jgi:hypothetical protein
MWIFCCGMQRSGSTLQFQLTARLVETAGLGRRVEWVRPGRFGQLRNRLAGEPSWKVFKIHVCSPAMAAEFRRDNATGVYTYRDLRDVFVSTMRKYARGFDELFASDFLEGCLEQYRRWTALPRVLTTRYEDMIADVPAEVERIAAHLGITLSADVYRDIAREHSLEQQRERIDEAVKSGDLREGIVKGTFYNPRTNLHTNHIHEGAVGGWKHVLADAQVERLEAKAGSWLVAHGYALRDARADA